MKKMDVIIILVGLLLGIGLIFFNNYNKNTEDKLVAKISVKGEEYKVVTLSEKEEIIVIETELGKNTLKFHNNGVEMIDATCHDHICEKMGFIDENGDMIVCLPNKVVVEIIGNGEGLVDVISR